jgi:hypothetical protein
MLTEHLGGLTFLLDSTEKLISWHLADTDKQPNYLILCFPPEINFFHYAME